MDDDEKSQRTRLLSALASEHFVLQSANSTTYAEASSRSTLYVMALSSSLVAMGFLSSSKEAFVPSVINNIVAGAALALLVRSMWPAAAAWLAPVVGVACALVLTAAFLVFQRLRFAEFDAAHAADEKG